MFKLRPFEFPGASDRTMVRRKDILKILPVCFFQQKGFKNLYKTMYNVGIISHLILLNEEASLTMFLKPFKALQCF